MSWLWGSVGSLVVVLALGLLSRRRVSGRGYFKRGARPGLGLGDEDEEGGYEENTTPTKNESRVRTPTSAQSSASTSVFASARTNREAF